ncbi:MAG: acyl carrier protein [Actinobacteria bacterium]|nr:acyl carrier protein [Actinomycetota bacterium]
MTDISPADVRAFLLHSLSGELSALGFTPDDVDDDFDLLVQGVLDSLGLLELVVAIDERFGIETDFENIDAEQLGVVGPFSRYIAEQGRAGPAS